MSSLQQYIDVFCEYRNLIDEHSPAILNGRRDEALRLLRENGLPQRKNERYRYTQIEEDFAPDFGLNFYRTRPVGDPYKGFLCGVPAMESSLYYIINDVVCPSQGKTKELPEGAFVLSFTEAAQRFPELMEKHYHQAAGRKYDAVSELNALLAQDGLLIYLQKGVKVEQTMQVVHISAATADMMSNRRLLIVAEEGASASVLFCDHMENKHHYLATQVTEVYAGDGADIRLYGMEETGVTNVRYNNIYVEQEAGSNVSLNDITLHNGHTRNQTDVRLLGDGANVELNGAYVADAEELLNSDIVVEHIAENCTSTMLHKYVLNDDSVGAFAGRVVVREGAQKTLANQTNANLLAAPTARAFSQPMLEIYADDVKCNHGSTIGKLDESALLYMRQRGIEEKEARLLLQHAFINDVLEHIHIDALRERISALVEARFRGEKCADGCDGCGCPVLK